MVLAGALDGHAEDPPFRRPFELPEELALAAEGADLAAVTAALRPRHLVGAAFVDDLLAVVGGDLGRADPAADLADRLEGKPRPALLGAGDLLVDATHVSGVGEDGVDGLVEAAAPVDVAHPVALGLDTELVEHAEELANEVL